MKLWALLRDRGLTNAIAFLVTALGAAAADVLSSVIVFCTVVPSDLGTVAAAGLPAFLILCSISFCCRWITQARISWWFAGVVASIRRSLIDKASRIEPAAWERLAKVPLRQGLSVLPARLTGIADNIANAGYTAILAFVLCCYLLWLCWPVGATAFIAYLIAGLYLGHVAHELSVQEATARQFDDKIRSGLTDLVLGRKELLLDPRKAGLIFAEDIAANVKRRKEARAPIRALLLRQTIVNRAIEPVLVSASILAVTFIPDHSARPGAVIALLLVYLLPFTIFHVAPQIVSGEAGALQLETLESHMGASARAVPAPAEPSHSDACFEGLELEGATYRYADGHGRFMVGPLSLGIERGTITFISGENGSGKSTLVKILTGLYAPRSGSAILNGRRVDLRCHRGLFSLILSEHYLFDRLFGLDAIDPTRANALLETFGLAQVTSYENGRFTRLDLSTGQRKRVALVMALLEDKPIMVLDEWAAEQDPGMRRRYYREILPELRAKGKAIVAVTHDERYLDACDQMVLMRDGLIRYSGPPNGWAGGLLASVPRSIAPDIGHVGLVELPVSGACVH